MKIKFELEIDIADDNSQDVAFELRWPVRYRISGRSFDGIDSILKSISSQIRVAYESRANSNQKLS